MGLTNKPLSRKSKRGRYDFSLLLCPPGPAIIFFVSERYQDKYIMVFMGPYI